MSSETSKLMKLFLLLEAEHTDCGYLFKQKQK